MLAPLGATGISGLQAGEDVKKRFRLTLPGLFTEGLARHLRAGPHSGIDARALLHAVLWMKVLKWLKWMK